MGREKSEISGFELWLGLATLFCASEIGAAPVVSPEPPTPDDGTTFGLYVGDQEDYDSNLFRVPAALEATLVGPNVSRQDYINTGTVGADGQWTRGRQIVDLDLQVDENRFAKNSSLNDVSGFAKLAWNWTITSALTGQLTAAYDRSLAPFAEAVFYGKDIVNTQDYFGQALYQLGPHWALFGDIRDLVYSHSADAARYNDYRSTSGSGGVEYATSGNDSIRLEYRYTDAYYPGGYLFDNAEVNRDYNEDTARLLIRYLPSEKTSIDAYVGYVQRNYREEELGKYSGDIWRATLTWNPTEKSNIAFAAWHELHAYTVSEADYFVSRGGSISPIWTATEKVQLSVIFSYEDQGYIAASNSVLITGPRTDKITAEQFNLLYKPRDNLLLNLFIRNEQRKSDVERYQYNDDLARASITYKFL